MKKIDIDRLAHLYYHEKKSVPEIAKIFDCTHSAIYHRMNKNGMQRRSYAEAHKLRYSQQPLDVDIATIVRLYFEEHLSLLEVGTRLGISSNVVRKHLLSAGYPTRKRGESKHPRKSRESKFTDAELAEMKRLYCEEGLSSLEIAHRYDCRDMTVRKHLKRHGVQLRTSREAQALRRKKQAAKTAKLAKTSQRTQNEQVTHERILQLRNEENLTIDAIAEKCSLSNIEVYNILQEMGGI